MPLRSEIICDADLRVFREGRVLEDRDGHWSVSHDVLRGGLSDGVQLVTLDNGRTRIELLPTRGMGVLRVSTDEITLKWDSPVRQPVHPKFVDPMRRGGIGWLDGFNELICRCGLGWHGAPGTDIRKDADGTTISEEFLPLHGRIANLPAHRITTSVTEDDSISVTGEVEEASVFGGRLRLRSTIETRVGSSQFRIIDEVTNLSSAPAEAELLYHCNFGRPLLGEGSRVHVAAKEIAPRDPRAAEGIADWSAVGPPEIGFAEQVYFLRPVSDPSGNAHALLTDSTGNRGVSIRFATRTLPWLAVWKNTAAEDDGYVLGIEPTTGFPNLRSVERRHGRLLNLQPGESVQFELAFQIAEGADEVSSLAEEIRQLQDTCAPTVHQTPCPDWIG